MKTTYRELKDAQQSFSRIIDAPIDVKLSYRIHKQAAKVKDAQKAIEKGRRDLIEKYGEKKDNMLSVPEEKLKEYNEELDKFLDAEFDFDIQLIPWDVLEKGGIKISGTDLAVLRKFIDIPEKIKE
jgi:hypothetical protein